MVGGGSMIMGSFHIRSYSSLVQALVTRRSNMRVAMEGGSRGCSPYHVRMDMW